MSMPLDNTATAIFGLVSWTVGLLVIIALMRTGLTLFKGKDANSFSPSGDDVSPFSGRLCRAHANCYEFIPFALAILLYAVATGQSAVTNGLAIILLATRVGQSLVHLMSTSKLAVMARFGFFLAQVIIVLYWSAKFTILKG